MRLDDGQFRDADSCDEIVNSELMGIATGQKVCFPRLELDGANDGL